MEKTITMLSSYIHLLFKRRISERCEQIGVSGAYFQILLAIGRHGSCNQNLIAQETHLAKPTVSLTLSNMENDGIIKRTVDQNDQRNTIISFTSQGEELDMKVRLLFEDEDCKITKLLNENEIQTVKASLEKIVNYLEDKHNGNI